ncbi:hypothetical protein CBR_g29684 [Chara braunii]|uniref:RNA polymerase sigma-70 region 2 domain-containing protein n=1 Tax=Chara braunii TaxID=69332 RepID=A0A388LB33_CHABU|nr:hypothetical protein CBR_g29684 [Chara braunii]|eukprot:GBG79537.1 hypothetical protein CBR_g29684 [Chara braunii]
MSAVAAAFADVASNAGKFEFSSGRREWTGGVPEGQTWRLSSRSEEKGRRHKEEALHAKECTWRSFACAPVCFSSEIGKLAVLEEGRCTDRHASPCLRQPQRIIGFYDRPMTIGGRCNGRWLGEEKRACRRCKWAPGARKNAKGCINGDGCFVKAISTFSMTLQVKHSTSFYVPVDVISRRLSSSSSSLYVGRVGTEAEYGATNLVRKRKMRRKRKSRRSRQLSISHMLQICSSYRMEEAGDLGIPPRTGNDDDDGDDHCDEEEEEEEAGGDHLVPDEIRRESPAMSPTLDGIQAFVSSSSHAASMDQKQQQEAENGYGTKEPTHCSSSDANNIGQEREVTAGVRSMEGTEVENEEVIKTTIRSAVSQEGKRRASEGTQLRASAFQATAQEAERRARRCAERVKVLRATMTSRSESHFRAKAALYSGGRSKGGRSGGASFSSSSDKCQSVQVDDGSHLPKRGSGTSSWIALVGDHPPLSRQEETSLSMDVRDLHALLSKKDQLAKHLGREPSDLEWAESEGISLCRLLARIGKGRAAKRRMVEANLKLVDSIAERFSGRGLSHNELCQEGVKGLLRSAEKYDSSKNVKFSTYSFDWIRQKIGNALRMYAKPVKIGRTAWDKMWILLSRKQALSSAKGGQPVSLEEAAIGSGVSSSVVRGLDLALTKSVQLDVPLTTGPSHSSGKGSGPSATSDLTLEGTLACVPAADTCPWKAVDELLMRRELNEAMSQLGACERDIIQLHFGLGGEEPHLKKEVAQELGITCQTVRIQEKRGLQQLKETWGLRLEPYLSESSSPPS